MHRSVITNFGCSRINRDNKIVPISFYSLNINCKSSICINVKNSREPPSRGGK